MEPDDVPVVADPAIVAVELDGRLSLYRPSTQMVLNLNESASLIWLELEEHGRRPVREVARALADRVGVDNEVMLRDVAAALDDLARAGFVTVG